VSFKIIDFGTNRKPETPERRFLLVEYTSYLVRFPSYFGLLVRLINGARETIHTANGPESHANRGIMDLSFECR